MLNNEIWFSKTVIYLSADSKIPDNKTTEFMKNSDYNIIVNSNTYDCTSLLCNGLCSVPDNYPNSGKVCWRTAGFQFSDHGKSKHFLFIYKEIFVKKNELSKVYMLTVT